MRGKKECEETDTAIAGEKGVDVVVHQIAFSNDQVDTGAQLVAGGIELDPAEANRIRKKIDWHILPLMCGEFAIVCQIIMRAHYNLILHSSLLDPVHG